MSFLSVSAFKNGQLPNLPKLVSVGQLTQIVGCNHWSIREFTENQLGKKANTEFLLYLLVNYRILPE